MKTARHRLVVVALASVLATGSLVTPSMASAHTRGGGFDDQYVFAATRGVNDMEGVHPAWKMPLFPITLVLDIAALPFAVIAGFVG